ncbi:hypothetical protein PsorP6_004608 [Peronosclerospora sorghi]|uniref:Uncharacterized protein n=1 Tax=Peronosclerospora sorghi TaxID=230839 RepID=A0ACC0VLZ3_9STRA|nr:hypothetical protein PsorP6_004608 [Peronosclerospora sorghi]
MTVVTAKRLPRPLQLAIINAARQKYDVKVCCPPDNLLCSICLDILCFPVTLPCGHNFDRGCILTAWSHDCSDLLTSPCQQQRTRLCPLCRQQTGIREAEELQINRLLKDLIVSLYPVETRSVATLAKQQNLHMTATSPRPNGGTLTNNTAVTAFRRRPNVRTFSSFVYVCAASVTDPPGFVLAVLLLLILVATACNPQPATAPPATSAMIMFDTMDRVCNGLSLMIHQISMHMDQLDQVSPWIRLLSYIL